MAALINERTENIGARRLYTIMERLLDEISFDAPEMAGKSSGDRCDICQGEVERFCGG